MGSCALFFLLIGWALRLPIPLAAVFPMFVVASVAGVVSMIPGGLGSFDVFMIIGLGFLGVSRADATGWLLLYRLFFTSYRLASAWASSSTLGTD